MANGWRSRDELVKFRDRHFHRPSPRQMMRDSGWTVVLPPSRAQRRLRCESWTRERMASIDRRLDRGLASRIGEPVASRFN
jgi:hypothetical protein